MARILGGRLVVAAAHDRPGDPEEHAVVVVEEGVPAVRILLDIVIDPEPSQRTLELRRRTAQGPVATPEAADDRAGAAEQALDLPGHHPVVHARGGKPVPGGEQECEAAAHAEADDPDPAGAGVATREPSADRVDTLEGGAVAAEQVAECRLQADRPPCPGEEVRRDRDVAGLRQPGDLAAQVGGVAERVVDDHDARPAPRDTGKREAAAQLHAGDRTGDLELPNGHRRILPGFGAHPLWWRA